MDLRHRFCTEIAPSKAQLPAQQLRQQRVAQCGEGAGLIGIAVDAVEHRFRDRRETFDQWRRWNDDVHVQHTLRPDALMAASGAGDERAVNAGKGGTSEERE